MDEMMDDSIDAKVEIKKTRPKKVKVQDPIAVIPDFEEQQRKYIKTIK